MGFWGFVVCIGLGVLFAACITSTGNVAEIVDATRHNREPDMRNGLFGWLLALVLGLGVVVLLCWLFGVGTVVRGVGQLVGLP